jgi:hypothetical protein
MSRISGAVSCHPCQVVKGVVLAAGPVTGFNQMEQGQDGM